MAQATRKLAHVTENFSVEIEGKTNAAILAEIKEAGYTLGSKSLAAMLSGERDQAGAFQIVSEPAEEAPAAPAPAPAPVEAAPAAPAPAPVEVPAPAAAKPRFTKEDQAKRREEAAKAKAARIEAARKKAAMTTANVLSAADQDAAEGQEGGNENADDNQGEEAGAANWKFKSKADLDAEAQLKAAEASKATADAAAAEPAGSAPAIQPQPAPAPVRARPRTLTPEPGTAPAAPAAPRAPKKEIKYTQPTDGSKPKIIWEHPDSPIAIRRGTKIDNMFQMLMRPEGATKAEMMEKFGWTEGGLGSVLFWEPKAKGYALVSEKNEQGVLTYHLHFRHGAGKVKPSQIVYFDSPKSAPAAAPAADTKRVSVPKTALANVPPLAGVGVTRRRAGDGKSK